MDTSKEYDEVIDHCQSIFLNKTKDYGTAWRVLRTISIVDQIYIKAQRIRTIQELKEQRIADDVAGEFAGIINYGVIGLMQLELPVVTNEDLSVDIVRDKYKEAVSRTKQLMMDKNHDYGEAWRNMSQESFVDLILMKLQRIRQILANDGRTIMSEGIDANYHDIINYAVFGMILMPKKLIA